MYTLILSNYENIQISLRPRYLYIRIVGKQLQFFRYQNSTQTGPIAQSNPHHNHPQMCTTFYQYMIGNCLLPSQQSQSHSFLKRFTRHCEGIILNINVLVILLNDINQQIRSFSTLTSICAWFLVAMVTPTFTRNTRYAIQSVSIRTAVLRI